MNAEGRSDDGYGSGALAMGFLREQFQGVYDSAQVPATQVLDS
jgi:hypothetical protein